MSAVQCYCCGSPLYKVGRQRIYETLVSPISTTARVHPECVPKMLARGWGKPPKREGAQHER